MSPIEVVIVVLCATAINARQVSFSSVAQLTNAAESKPEIQNLFKTLHRKSPATTQTIRRGYFTTNWFTQKLDHFNDSDTRTWQMRYLSNAQHFVEGGPIFVYLEGLTELYSYWLLNGHFYDMARQNKAYLIQPEFRYCGESRPTPTMSTSNLKHLNATQILADVAHLIRTIKADNSSMANSKVILAGKMFSGSLVVWFKRLYPDLVDGAWASSAPLLAKADFYEACEVYGEAIRAFGSQQCYNRIQNGIAELENMFATNRSSEVKRLLNICDNFDEKNDLDLGSLFLLIAEMFAIILMHQAEENTPVMCGSLMKYDNNLTGLAELFLIYTDSPTCTEVSFQRVIQDASNSTDFSISFRQWAYLSCNEFGWYQTSASRNQPFGTKFPVTFRIATCAELFGNQYPLSAIESNALNTNELFGGQNPNVQNVYRTYGEFDFWRPLGSQGANDTTIIPRASACSDLESISFADSPDVRAAKEEIASLIRGWVGKSDELAKN